MVMLIRFLHIVILFLVATAIQSQQFNKNDFKVYKTRDGISSNDINAIVQDKYGYIWIGTQKGLNRFDGSGFRQFFSDSLPESLSEDRVFNLKWINDEELGILTGAGLNIMNTRTLQMRSLLIPADSAKNISRVNRIFDIAADKKGNLFIVTSAGFYHFKNNQLFFRYDHQEKASTFGWDIIKRSDKVLLISTSKGLYIYDIEKKDFHQPTNNDDVFLRNIVSPGITFRFKYHDETLFALGHKGADLILFDINKKASQVVTGPPGYTGTLNFGGYTYRLNDTTFAGLSSGKGFRLIHHNKQTGIWVSDSTVNFENEYCTSVLLDKNNQLWVGTSDGLYKQNKTAADIYLMQLPGDDGSLQRTITGITVANNKIFAATFFDGIYVFDNTQPSETKHILYPKGQTHIPQLIKNSEDSLLSAGMGFLINTRNLEYKKIEEIKISGGLFIRSMFKSSNNMIYFVKNRTDTLFFKNQSDKDFSFLHLPDLKKIITPAQISEDNVGNLWIGGYGLVRFNTQSKKIDLHLDSFPYIKRLNNQLTSNIVFDNNGRMYFGVMSNGLIIYDPKEKTFSHLTRSDGLPDNMINGLYIDNNTLWLATENGLASYDIVNKKVCAFGVSDGISADVNNISALYFDTSSHQLYAASAPSIVRFDPALMKKNSIPPSFFIESIDIAGKESIFHPGNSITVLYKHNTIAINLAAINFEDAPQQLFAYRILNNGDEPWQELGTQRRINFNELAAGKHRLQVKVYIRNQSWLDQVKEIIIIVKPPFWKTIWFYLLIASLIGSLLFFLHKLRLKQHIQKANIDKQLAQTEMKALHAQMNPHFIFNCLNSIREMILNNENQQASHYLSKFAQLIRITLNQSSKQFITLENTIDYIQRYIELEKIRNENFNYTIELDERLQTDEIMIHPMLIQPFIENAIWHGAVPGKHLNVKIRFIKNGEQMVCHVEDNGPGIETTMNSKKEIHVAHSSIGIANVKERIKVLNEKYNLHSELKIEDRSKEGNGVGTVVQLFLPIKSIIA